MGSYNSLSKLQSQPRKALSHMVTDKGTLTKRRFPVWQFVVKLNIDPPSDRTLTHSAVCVREMALCLHTKTFM